MTNWQYTDATETVVMYTDSNGAVVSSLATAPAVQAFIAGGGTILPPPPPAADITGSAKALAISEAHAHVASGNLAAAITTLLKLQQ